MSPISPVDRLRTRLDATTRTALGHVCTIVEHLRAETLAPADPPRRPDPRARRAPGPARPTEAAAAAREQHLVAHLEAWATVGQTMHEEVTGERGYHAVPAPPHPPWSRESRAWIEQVGRTVTALLLDQQNAAHDRILTDSLHRGALLDPIMQDSLTNILQDLCRDIDSWRRDLAHLADRVAPRPATQRDLIQCVGRLGPSGKPRPCPAGDGGDDRGDLAIRNRGTDRPQCDACYRYDRRHDNEQTA